MDKQVFELGRQANAYKSYPSSSSHLHVFSPSSSKRSHATMKKYPKRFSLWQRGRKEEMGLGSVGKDM